MHKQNQEIIARSPAVVKLLGEHAVVYGKLCIAAAVEQYANVKIEIGSTDAIELEFTNISGADSRQETTSSKIASIYNEFASRDSISKFLEKQNGENMLLLPCAVIIGRLNHEFDADIKGIKITFSSDIPMQYGLASSAALSTALVVALVKLANVKISNEKIIDIARDGERIIHENENAGRIDVNTSFYGNIVSFDAKFGANPHKLDYEILLMLIDTGPKKKTSEMVAKVAELYKKDKNNTEKILNKIDMCSAEGLSAIEKRDIKRLGELMYEDQDLLKMLEVSNDKIDKAVSICKVSGGYGAKLSGGGGGGMVIAIPQDKNGLIKALIKGGFKVSETKISSTGAIDYLQC